MNDQELEERISAEAVENYFQEMREQAIFTPVVPLTVVAVMWSQIHHGMLIGWFALVALGIGGRYAITRNFEKQDSTDRDAAKWRYPVLSISVYLAILWSVAILLFFVETSTPHQVFLTTLAVTLGIGSISAGTHWLPLYYLYGLPILATLALRLELVGTLPYMALGLMIFAALMASYNFARKLNATVRSEMRLRYESAGLARELQLKSEEAQEAVYAKSRVLATASHDLRQPLHALSLFIDALKEARTQEEHDRLIKRIDASLTALRKLFDALFDMSRLDANVIQPEISDFDIRECLVSLSDEFRADASRKNLRLRVRCREMAISSDRALLERILRNLISNAIRYTPSGGVLVSARARNQTVLVQVWDSGVGIPRDSHEKAFVEFQQLHNARDNPDKGLGFGLAIVRRLCELMDYPLRLSSRVGKGSVFSFEVPAGNSDSVDSGSRHQRDQDWDHTGQRILVVDDDHIILGAMHTLLSQWGFNVTTVEDLKQSQDYLHALGTIPDLIVSDLSLQGRDSGIDVITQLRAHYGVNVPGVLITGTTDPEKLRIAEASGLKLVQKPVRPPELRSIIHHHLLNTGRTPL